jgi:hypothetical protein
VYTNTSVNLTLSDGATTQVSTISLTPGPLALGPNPGYLQSLTINNSQTFAILGGVPPFTVSGTFNSGGFISSPQLVTTGSNPNDFVWNVSYTSGMEASDWVAAPDLITVTDSAGNSAGYNLYVQDPCGIDPGSSVCCNGNPSDPSCQQNNPQGPDCSNWNNDQFDCMDNSGPFGESCTWYDDGLGDGGGSCGD